MISQGNKIKFRNIFILIVLGILFGSTYNYLYYPHNLVGFIEAISISIISGISIGIIQEFLLKKTFKKISFYQLLLARTALYSFVIVAILLLVLSIKISYDQEITYSEAILFYLHGPLFRRDFSFAISIVFIATFIAQIIQLIGLKNLIRLISGHYHKPKEVRRIFMFIDLNDSTTLAEQLGDVRYSFFIKEYFNDVSDAINMYEGEIYQYVGDEVSIVWSIGRKNEYCLKCFFEVKRIIDGKRNYYLETFGHVPQFKAGAHVGTVVVNEVGKSKKALVYHGDVVNTTSRIIGKCKELKQGFLISEELLAIVDKYGIDILKQGDLTLKGKVQKVKLFGIRQQKEI